MEITGIRLRNSYQTCYVDTNKLFIKRNTLCLAETEHGIDLGRVTKCSCHLGQKDFDVKGKLLRKTTEEDLKKIPDIISVEEKAFNICREKATEKKLEMSKVANGYITSPTTTKKSG